MLSQQAFNAFLKTLEEPPSYAIFILATTEKHKIIPTILSRCQIFDFRRIQVQDMVEHLQSICDTEDIQADEDALHIIGQKADGALRDALSIFDRIVSFSGDRIAYEDVIENLNVLDYDYYFRVVEAMLAEDRNRMLLLFDEILRKGFDPDIFINGLAEHLRNILVCKDRQTLQLLEVSGALQERYQQQAQQLPASLLLTALNIANDCDLGYRLARNKRLHVEMALIKMTYINRAFRLSEDQLAAASPEKKTAEVNAPPVEQPAAPEPAQPAPRPGTETEGTAPVEPPPVPKQEAPTTPQPVKAAKHVLPKMKKLDAMMAELQEEEATSADPPAEPVTLERAQAAWAAYMDNCEQASVKAILRNAELALTGEQELLVTVASNLAENTIRQEDNLVAHLRETLAAPDLMMRIEVDKSSAPEPPKPKRLLNPKEKYLAMRETNPLLQEMQKRFDLRPDE